MTAEHVSEGNNPQDTSSGTSHQSRDITADVHKIRIESGAIKVILKQSPTPLLVVRATAGILPKVLTIIEGNRLTISPESLVITRQDGNGATVIANGGNVIIRGGSGGSKNIQINSVRGAVQISGSGNVVMQNFYGGVRGNVVAGDLVMGTTRAHEMQDGQFVAEVTIELPCIKDINVRGSAQVEYLSHQHDDLAVEISGSARAILGGTVRELDIEISGSAVVQASGLRATKARLRVSGSGSIRATTLESVKARVSGSGQVRIAGNPVNRDTDVSGSGRIHFVD